MKIIYLVVTMWSYSEPSIYVKRNPVVACLEAITQNAEYSGLALAYKAAIDKKGRILWMKPLTCVAE